MAKLGLRIFGSTSSVGETDPRAPMGPADRGPFRFGGGRRSHEEQIEAKHTSSLPSFGALRRDNTPTAACLVVLSGVLALQSESVMFSGLRMDRCKLSEASNL